ncbi:GNAT family N-acetyltransferase [Streptomyces sp. SR27]|uniref:GNAT family N-acetyltransferase n=1 Tax=Streptomyces sp. SR27 TaxID=3076630 RepID=UPI00295C1CAD|nr:GNAT family N-acetyltransferase [Streptomyces sp. SR27]MDV9190214.1 GNAT family N-acetyltransferase [Streptomyces sp. SR27]
MDLLAVPRPVIALDDALTLRVFDAGADLPEFLRVVEESLDHLRPWMPWAAEHSPDRATAFLSGLAAQWASGDSYTYAIVLDGALVGSCGLHRHEDTPDGALEVGYWLHPAATGRGVVTRAARALVEEAFLMPGVERVEIVHDPANLASGAVPARLGFTAGERRPAEALAPAETGELQVWHLSRSPGPGAVPER